MTGEIFIWLLIFFVPLFIVVRCFIWPYIGAGKKAKLANKAFEYAHDRFFSYVDKLFKEKGRQFFVDALVSVYDNRYDKDFPHVFKNMCEEKRLYFNSEEEHDETYKKKNEEYLELYEKRIRTELSQNSDDELKIKYVNVILKRDYNGLRKVDYYDLTDDKYVKTVAEIVNSTSKYEEVFYDENNLILTELIIKPDIKRIKALIPWRDDFYSHFITPIMLAEMNEYVNS